MNDTIFAFSSVDDYLAAAVRDVHEKYGITTFKKFHRNLNEDKNGENYLRWISEDWNEISQQGARISWIQR